MSWSFLDFTGLSHFFGKLPEKLVTTDTTQSISGTKSFQSTILGSVSGSAASAAKDGAGNVIADTYETKADAATHLSKSDAAGTYLSKTDAASAYVQTGAVDQTIGGTKTFSKPIAGSVTGSSGSCTGNAASATKLQTARTINGIAFDGTANITIPVTVPAGVIIPFAGTSVPTGYLLCNGAAVSRTDYANLFAAIGTLYGAGDVSTTFNLPDARDRVLQGASGTHSAGSYIAAGLPNITGSIYQGMGIAAIQAGDGAFDGSDPTGYAQPRQVGAFPRVVSFNASRSNALYGANSTVQMPAIATNFIIKY